MLYLTYAFLISTTLLELALSYPFSSEISWHDVNLDLLNVDVVIDTADQQDVPYYEIANSETDVEIKAMTVTFMNGTVVNLPGFTSRADDQHSMMYDLVLETAGSSEKLILEAGRVGQMLYNHYNQDSSDKYGIGSSDEDGENYVLDEDLLFELPPGWHEVPYDM